jgi:hypothetical protein
VHIDSLDGSILPGNYCDNVMFEEHVAGANVTLGG